MKDVIFIKPKKFGDSKKIVNYIVEDKILHIDLTSADKKMYQRVLDFISGAVYIKDAKLINPSDKVFVSLPKDVKYSFYGETSTENKQSGLVDLRFDEEEEIKPVF